jgi:uncharacterized protein YfaS (alpha-2-macroglobulin family)
MNKPSVESAFSGLPDGTFTWTDEATLVFAPTEPYQSDTKLNVTIANSIQSASGFGITEPIQLSFTVADYLRGSELLPKPNTTDVNVDAPIVISFNQPVVPLGADPLSLTPAFSISPAVKGLGEWINTSTYIFNPAPALLGGTEYTVSVDNGLETASGTGLDGSVVNAWKFVTARPGVLSVNPSSEVPLAPDARIELTFNQPMDRQSVQLQFQFSGNEGPVSGGFSWNNDDTVMTFTPEQDLLRGVGYSLNVGAGARSKGGMTLGTDYGSVFQTFENFGVRQTETNYGFTSFMFTAPLAPGNYERFVSIAPVVDNITVDADIDRQTIYVYGNFLPDTNYAFELSDQLSDQWGQTLGTPYILEVRTPILNPYLNVLPFGSSTLFVRPDEPVLSAIALNVQNADVVIAPLSLQDFLNIQYSFELQQAYTPTGPAVIPQTFELPANQASNVKLNLTEENNQLVPGLYYVNITSPQIQSQSKMIYFAASSQINLTFKAGATQALVWAVDLPSQTPVAGAPVNIYDEAGNTLATGTTDGNGLWQGNMGHPEGRVFAMLASPGDQNFSLAMDNWNMGINAWDFGYSQNVQPPHNEIYMYTDRPIYRPGQTVYFRGVVRQAFNGRYELPSITSVPIILNDAQGTQLANINAQLSPFGTFNGELTLSQDAIPGSYTFINSSLNFYLPFQVAEYRKPEINLQAAFSSDEIKWGSSAQMDVNARYFFDAPAGDVRVNWSLYTKPSYFYLPNYQTGLIATEWLDVFRFLDGSGSQFFGEFIDEGMALTSAQGTLSIGLPPLPESDAPQILTLEATAIDASGLPVSTRTVMTVHPAEFYIGLRPDQWLGTADKPVGFEVYTADWEGNPSGGHTLTAEFKQVRWQKEMDQAGFPTYTPVYTPVSSSNLSTGADGKARLSFVPPNAGTFMLDVSGEGARSQVLVWVSGAGTAAWPDPPNQRLELTADKASYQAGETAKIFIPNPFPTSSLALVTVERGLISSSEVVNISGSGMERSISITDADAPNVYVSVTVLGQGNDFRHGLVNLSVAPDAQELNVQLSPNPSQAGPRDTVTFDVLVTDHQGQPVQGEFSLAVVDEAVLALADSNAEDILPAYYSEQPLGIETSLSLAAYGGRAVLEPGGLGGGGGEEAMIIRQDFPDTAYWNPSLITSPDGRGVVTMTLPDSLTTWNVDVRGLTTDTKVGQAETQIVSTKPLLIRPVTPRFMVSGDHVLMAAVVNNNTSDKLSVTVNIQADGFVLDNPESATRSFEISPNAQARVEWWGTAGLGDSADLVFSVTTDGTPSLQDSARPVWGALPILKYIAPQAFVTGGVLRDASAQQEVVSLPRTFVPGAGSGLDVELSPSLAGNLLTALDAMEVPPSSSSAETILSYLLPNIEVHRALRTANVDDPELSERVSTNLNANISRVQSLQNTDGGWSWWGQALEGEESDLYISSYVLFGLSRAKLSGGSVSDDVLSRAVEFVQKSQPLLKDNSTAADIESIVFAQFALSQSKLNNTSLIDPLYQARDRMNPSSRALLVYIMNGNNPTDTRIRELIGNLEAEAIRTSLSAHWETSPESIVSLGTPIYTTSLVLYSLAQIDPTNPIVFDAVRYLSAHRNARGLWNIGHDNAWAIMALNEAMVGLGDLRSDYTFNASLNGKPLLNGDVNGIQLEPLEANVPVENLIPNAPNLLTIQRADGLGRLYYNAALMVNRPVRDVKPLNAGISIERVYCLAELDEGKLQADCTPLTSLQLAPDQNITATLTLTLPHDSYYVIVEDHIPAGMEILNRNLKTSQLGADTSDVQTQFNEGNPLPNEFGRFLFNDPQIHDDGILFTADYLPAGTYTLTYTLVPVQAGEFQVLPAHAWQAFFPEVQGTSTGAMFEIKP